MALFTAILNLLKKNPATDGTDTFNIQTMLNDNWDKIDAALGLVGVRADVRAATTANVTLSGLQTVDGVALAAGDRVLVKNQTTGTQNGVYVAGTGAWARSADADSSGKWTAGMSIYVKEGSANGGTGWVLASTGTVVLGTTALSFVQKTGAGSATPGSATDTVIGDRTITDSIVPSADTGSITNLFSWMGNTIKSITGTSSWRTLPSMTISAIITAMGLKAPLASPVLTGTPIAPTAVAGTSTTQISTTEFTSTAVAAHAANTSHVPYGAASGSANAYVVTLSPSPTSLTTGMALAVLINTANTGASTLNVNSLGAKSILTSKGAALTTGKLVASGVYTMRYNGTAFILQGEGGDYGTAAAAQVLAGYSVGTDAGIISGTITDRSGLQAANQYVSAVSAKADQGGNIVFEAPAGYYIPGKNAIGYGNVIWNDPNFLPANIKTGTSVLGITGTFMVDNSKSYRTRTYLNYANTNSYFGTYQPQHSLSIPGDTAYAYVAGIDFVMKIPTGDVETNAKAYATTFTPPTQNSGTVTTWDSSYTNLYYINGTIYKINPTNMTQVTSSVASSGFVTAIVPPARDFTYIIENNPTNAIRKIRLSDLALISTTAISGHALSVNISERAAADNSGFVYLASAAQTVVLKFNSATGASSTFFTLPSGTILNIKLSKDGTRMIVVSTNGTLYWLDASTGALNYTTTLPISNPQYVFTTFSSDGFPFVGYSDLSSFTGIVSYSPYAGVAGLTTGLITGNNASGFRPIYLNDGSGLDSLVYLFTSVSGNYFINIWRTGCKPL